MRLPTWRQIGINPAIIKNPGIGKWRTFSQIPYAEKDMDLNQTVDAVHGKK